MKFVGGRRGELVAFDIDGANPVPSAFSRFTRWPPMNPPAPLTKIRFIFVSGDAVPKIAQTATNFHISCSVSGLTWFRAGTEGDGAACNCPAAIVLIWNGFAGEARSGRGPMKLSDAEIAALAEKYSSVRVLCAGDVMLDRFIYGDVTRISPEAPIPVFSVREERSMLGGAGNVARNIAALGAGQDFITVVGQDAAAEEVIRELLALENCEPGIIEEPARRTSVKTRYLAHQQQMLRVDSESTEPISEERFEELLERFRAALPSCDIVVLSDYAKGLLAGNRAAVLIEAARVRFKGSVRGSKRAGFQPVPGGDADQAESGGAAGRKPDGS